MLSATALSSENQPRQEFTVVETSPHAQDQAGSGTWAVRQKAVHEEQIAARIPIELMVVNMRIYERLLSADGVLGERSVATT